MPVVKAQNLELEIVSILKNISGRSTIDLSDWISRDIGIYGGDGIQLLYELEEKFGVDLNPLIEAHTVYPPPGWWGRLLRKKHAGAHTDMTVKELVEYIIRYHRMQST
jgi:hypothetical protein